MVEVVSNISEAVHHLYEHGPEKFHVLITHGGLFHADEVMATAIIIKNYNTAPSKNGGRDRDKFLVVRGNCTIENIQELKNEFPGMEQYITTYDVGKIFDPSRRIFDHHQDDAPCDPDDNHKFAAAGQLWRDLYGFSTDPCTQFIYKYVKKVLITPIDIQDNTGKNRNLLSDIIKDMNLSWDDDPTEYSNDDCFYNAVMFALSALNTEIHKGKSIYKAQKCVGYLNEVRPYEGGGTYIFDEEWLIPPQEVFKAKKAAYLVQPSTYENDKWQVMARPGLGISYAVAEEDGCTFVHKNRFLATYNSKEQAIAAAEANLYGKLQERLANENNKGV